MNSTEPMIHIYIYWCHNILIPQNFEPGWVKKKNYAIYIYPEPCMGFNISVQNIKWQC